MRFTGTWNITIATPIGKQAVQLTIKEENGVIQGQAKQGEEIASFIDPKQEGQHLTWTQQLTRPLKLTLKFDVTVNGDTMSGTAKAGFLPSSTLTGARVTQQ